jgi:hypothetical protein
LPEKNTALEFQIPLRLLQKRNVAFFVRSMTFEVYELQTLEFC